MADLKETDEDGIVEKAAMRFPGGVRRLSRRQIRDVKTQNAKDGELRSGKRTMLTGTRVAVSVGPNRRGSGGKAPPSDRLSALRAKRGHQFKFSSTFGRKGYGANPTNAQHTRLWGRAHATRVRKSSDPLDVLYSEIEKAAGRGLIRGGSRRIQRKISGGLGARAIGEKWMSNRTRRMYRAENYLSTRTGKGDQGATPARVYRGQGGLSPRQRIARFRTGKYK